MLILSSLITHYPTQANDNNTAIDLSVEDLLNVEVTSVSKKAQALNDAPAAVFVISNDDIRRSGATSIPDALRLAPGLDVARINANQWAVSARGFNGRLANKLQVLIDGRSVYNRAFAGVDWENQDVMLEDVERIEVIRGPGATMWGANAVNGVINIITKTSNQTQGGLLSAGGGSFEREFGSFRYGAQLGDQTNGRVYLKGFNRGDNIVHPELSSSNAAASLDDHWNKQQTGFKLDSHFNARDELTVQGDFYRSATNLNTSLPDLTTFNLTNRSHATFTQGGNLLSRFQHTFSPTSEYKLQFYYDAYARDMGVFQDSRHTLDLDFQHRFMLYENQELIWGANYRFGHDHLIGNPQYDLFAMSPISVNDQLASVFIQDEISLLNNSVKLTLGSKLEHNDYSGFEGQPSARVMWIPHNHHRLWAGVSRSVRTPSRGEQGIRYLSTVAQPESENNPTPYPAAIYWQGNPAFGAESVYSYETGYRTTFLKSVSLDITGFYNRYQHLETDTPQTPQLAATGDYLEYNLLVTNQQRGHTYGVEIASVWQMLDWWRWDLNHSWLHTVFYNAGSANAISPQHHSSIRSAIALNSDIDFDLWLRYVDRNYSASSFNSFSIPAYLSLDLRTAWRPMKNLELSVTGQNLLQAQHQEYEADLLFTPTYIVRGVYGKINWKF